MYVGNTGSYSAGFANLQLPQQGVTAEGRVIWGFTVEQLTDTEGQLVLIPALNRAPLMAALREQGLLSAQENAAQEQLPSDASFRAPDGQPQAKVRKAVQPQSTASMETKASEVRALNLATGLSPRETSRLGAEAARSSASHIGRASDESHGENEVSEGEASLGLLQLDGSASGWAFLAPFMRPDALSSSSSNAGGLALLPDTIDRSSSSAHGPGAERTGTGRKSKRSLPAEVSPLTWTVGDATQAQEFKSQLKAMLTRAASEDEVHALFKRHDHLWRSTESTLYSRGFHAGFLVAVFECLPELREASDRLKIARALGRYGSIGLSSSSLLELSKALRFMAKADTVAPDLIAQLLLDANATGKQEINRKTGALRPLNQFTKNSGWRGFAEPMVDMLVAQSDMEGVETSDVCRWAYWLGRMFSEDTQTPKGTRLFTDACALLPLNQAAITAVRAAFKNGLAGRVLSEAGALVSSSSSSSSKEVAESDRVQGGTREAGGEGEMPSRSVASSSLSSSSSSSSS